VDDDTTVVFKATVSDPEGENVRLEVEVQPLGTSFLGVPTGTSGFQVGPATATVTLLGLTPSTQYHWQARTRDILGHVSAWVSFGGNPESAVDFTIP
jgi:hypothetical protein